MFNSDPYLKMLCYIIKNHIIAALFYVPRGIRKNGGILILILDLSP